MTIAQIRLRRGTSAQWAQFNPILADGEPGWDTTADQLKMGDGVLHWLDLPWQTANVGELNAALAEINADVAAAQAAAAAAAEVGATTDVVMAARVNDDDSAFRQALTGNGEKPVGRGELGLINVKDYGAVGDYNATTGTGADDTTAIQAAVNAAVAGQTIWFPKGRYKITSTIDISKPALRFEGVGGNTQNEGGSAYYGSAIVGTVTGMTMLAYGLATVSGVSHSGPQFENLNFVAPASATGVIGLHLRLVNYSTATRCGFRGLGTGIMVNAATFGLGPDPVIVAGGDASWNLFLQNNFRDCGVGIDIPNSGGTLTMGGSFNNCTVAIRQGGGSQLRVIGIKSDGGPIETAGQGAVIMGCVAENSNPFVHFKYNAAVANSGQKNQVRGCYAIAATNVAPLVVIDAGCTDTVVQMEYANATYLTAVQDAGTRTRRDDTFGRHNVVTAITPTTTTTVMSVSNPAETYRMDMSASSGSGRNFSMIDAAFAKGRRFTIKKTDSGANALTIVAKTSSGQTFDGAASYILSAPNQHVTLESDGANWAVVGAGGAATGSGVQTSVFTSAGTWTKPAGVTMVQVTCIAGSGGGGSGRRGAAGTVRSGGGGGAGGGMSTRTILASELTATVTCTPGTAGTGGAAVTTDDTNGTAGTNGQNSTFGAYVRASGGTGGGAGAAAAAAAGAAGNGISVGGVGAASSATGGAGGASPSSGTTVGGGAGGGITTGNVPAAGGGAGTLHSVNGSTAAGGAVDGTLPTTGLTATVTGNPGGGGGGGAASITTAAQAGAPGALYSGGGGGGGASVNGNNSGAGGDGQPGVIIVTAW